MSMQVPIQEASSDVAGEGWRAVGRIVSVLNDKSPSFTVMHARLSPGTESVSPGTWLAVAATSDPEETRFVLVRVLDSFEFNPHEDPQGSLISDVLPIPMDYAREGESTIIYRLTELEPMEEARLDEGKLIDIREVVTLPRAGSPVYDAPEDLITGALGLEPHEELGIRVGTLRGSNVPVMLKRSTIQRHIFIAGGIGSGKSYTRGVLLEELHSLGVPQVNIDPNGEMVEATEELGGLNLRPAKEGFRLPLSSLTAQDVVNAIPGVKRGTNIETLIAYAHEDLLKTRTLSHGQHFTVDDLVQNIERVAPVLKMDAAGTLRPALQRARSLEQIPYIGEPFDWKTQLKPGAVINIDCRGQLVSDLRLIVASIARDLQRLSRAGDNLFVALSIDEFHLVAPNDDSSVTTQVLREIARIGRHYKIGLILTTQSPQDVDRSILKRLLTRFLHAIEPDQLDALRGVFSDASAGLVKSLPKLPQGTCVVTGAFETVRHAAVCNIRTRRTTHGGGTPDIWTDFEEHGWTGKHPLPIDLDEV